MNVFLKRQLEFTIQLGTGTFGEQVGSTVTLRGFRSFATLSAPCGDSMGATQIRIFGLSQSKMNQLTVIGPINQVKPKNQVLIKAGDSENGLTTIFQGVITSAWADYNQSPEVVFNIIAFVGMDLAIKPVDAVSYPDSADVEKIMQTLASAAGLAFSNEGVNVQLSNPYFSGTVWQQIKECAYAARINHKIERQTLTIWPKNKAVGADIPLISADTGMIGYPSLSSQGMTVKSLFNPNIIMGGLIDVQSSVPVATGRFNVFNYTHDLSAEVPGGPWFTNIDCFPQI